MFVIRMMDGEEIHATERDKLTINPDTGVLTVHRVDGFEEATTHYSPAAWREVTHRVKSTGVRPPTLVSQGTARKTEPSAPAGG